MHSHKIYPQTMYMNEWMNEFIYFRPLCSCTYNVQQHYQINSIFNFNFQFQFQFQFIHNMYKYYKTHLNIIQVHIARCCLAYKVVFRQHLHNNIQYIYICDGVCTTCVVQMYAYLFLEFNVCGVYVMCCI